ncbi:Bug family tripartite tricarboxylate transporter substrate binding protein [Pseudorhodoferax sp.]|uniref:Bug family tripartite tricarboxylate transporter substrate binding protein n=1 Tax=Pseudorhodoferax sp. TaxID=1993553 RepID=UPI0039E561CF
MRRAFLKTAVSSVAALFCTVAPGLAQAQHFKGPIKIVVPQAPGGGTDLVARLVAPGLSKELGQTVIIDNKPGASGQIGAQTVQNAVPDGTTILCSTDHSLLIVPVTEAHVKYTVGDFVALGQGARTSWALLLPVAAGYKDFKDYTAALKRDPVKRSYGVPLTGGAPGVVGDAIGKAVGVEMEQIPFAGSAPVSQNVMANQIPAGVTGMPEAVSVSRGDKARTFAVTGEKRSPLLPDVPTFSELGIAGLDKVYTFVGFFGPKGMPPEAANEFNAALRKALADPAVREKLTGAGLTAAPTTLEEAGQEVTVQAKYWKDTLGKR